MSKIEDLLDDLFSNIEKEKLYKDYVMVKEKLSSNYEIMELINEIKRLQKIATNTNDKVVEESIIKLYDKLYSYPIYQSYLIIKDELQENLLMIRNLFDKYFKDLLFIDIN